MRTRNSLNALAALLVVAAAALWIFGAGSFYSYGHIVDEQNLVGGFRHLDWAWLLGGPALIAAAIASRHFAKRS